MSIDNNIWKAPHAAWMLSSTGSYYDFNFLTTLLKKGYNNSFQVTVKLFKLTEYYSEQEINDVCKINFREYSYRNDIVFASQSIPVCRSAWVDPTPIVITTRDMDNSVVGYLSLVDLEDLMLYVRTLKSINAARLLFSFSVGISSTDFTDFWYGNPLTRVSSKDQADMRREDEILIFNSPEGQFIESRDW